MSQKSVLGAVLNNFAWKERSNTVLKGSELNTLEKLNS